MQINLHPAFTFAIHFQRVGSFVEPAVPLMRQHSATHEKVTINLFMGQLMSSLAEPTVPPHVHSTCLFVWRVFCTWPRSE